VPHEREAESTLGFITRQAGGGIEHRRHFGITGQLTLFGGDAAGDLGELLPAGKFMLDHDQQLFQLGRDLDHGTQDDDEGAVLLAGDDLLQQRLHDLGRLQEAMKILQDEDGGPVRRSQGVDRPDGGQWVGSG